MGVAGVEPFRDLVGRDFRPDAPNRVWAADIKQTKTGEGWLYLAAVQDLFSRRIVGWAMAPHMRQELVVEALEMAVQARRPAKGTIHHSDHGGQFISLTFGQACHDAGIAQSMGAVGSCFDNAVAETFFATLTKERLLHDAPKKLGDPGRVALGDLRVHRGLLQPDTAALDARDALPGRVRSRPRRRRSRRPRARRHERGRARKICAQPSVVHSYDDNINLTPRNRGGPVGERRTNPEAMPHSERRSARRRSRRIFVAWI